MKSGLSAAARDDLIGIGDHIAQRNRPRAASFTDELLSACEALAEQPLAWPLIPRHERAGLRRRPYR
jgi:toxin ParE1/3/4